MHGIGLLQAVSISSAAAGTAIDTANYEGVVFVATAAQVGAQVQHGDTGGSLADVGDPGDLAPGESVQVHKPRKRFVAIDVASTVLLYGARTLPAENPPASRSLVSPG